MGWLFDLVKLVELVPTVVEVIVKVITIIKGHPEGAEAGVTAVHATLDAAHPPSDHSIQSKIGQAPDLVGMD